MLRASGTTADNGMISSKYGLQGGTRMMRLTAVGFLAGVALPASQSPDSVTFNKDVLPILQKNCQGCHRPGEVAPMSLVSFAEARPWAKAIKTAVLARKMPPYCGSANHGG